MTRQTLSLLWRCIVICVYVKSVRSEDVELKCDEFDRCAEYECAYGIGPYCTVTGLIITHSQHVIVNKASWPKRISSDAYNFMKFYDSSMLYIPPSIFSEFEKLKKLDISYSGIVELTRNIFTSASVLDWLNLSHNNISETTGSIFLGANTLREIDMSYNRISKLSEHSFKGLKTLVELNLAGNQIGRIEENIFSDNELLEIVNLKGNRIDHIDVGVFRKLKLLNLVNLADNELTNIDPNTFVNCNNLLSINLPRNQLKILRLNVGGYFKKLNAENNQIESFSINCTNLYLQSIDIGTRNRNTNISCQSLEYLELSNNAFNNLNNLTNFPNLRGLSLSNNNVGKLNISTLSKLKNLERLNLKNTTLSGLTFGTFSQQGKLTVLDLSDNNLQDLNLDIFLPYMYLNLEELYLNGNNLTEIGGRHTFASFSSLKKLGLRANKFNCSYLVHLISSWNFSSKIEFNSEGRGTSDEREHIHGVECIPGEKSFAGDRAPIAKKSSLPTLSYEASLLHVKLLEQHLLIMKCFVIVLAFLGLCFLAYKIIQMFADRRKSFPNIISYRSTNTIQSELGI